MLTRREFLGITAAVLGGGANVPTLAARQGLSQDDLLSPGKGLGQVTLLHLADLHAQLTPLYFREPSINLGVGPARGKPPHITGQDFLEHFGIEPGSLHAYMLSSVEFAALAREYGRVGGIDRIATLVNAVRSERPDNTLLLDSGDFWQGSYPALASTGGDMVRAMNALGVEATTGHWEFTYGQDRVRELIDQLECPFLAGNVRDTMWEEPVFESTAFFERQGVTIAVIGQAFPYTPIANPRYMIPDWSFGIREDAVQQSVDAAREKGAQLVVLLSHNGFDVDRKMAGRVEGIDVILAGHTHDAIPRVLDIDGTLLVGSGSHGKFLSRLDLDVGGDGVRDYRYHLIPVLTDAIEPDAEMARLVEDIRRPHQDKLAEVLGETESLLYRRGNFNGTLDDLICNALLERRDAQIALSPGFRWGASLLPGQQITAEDIYDATAITYPETYRNEMSGEMLKMILEDVADNLFNEDPYYQQGGDMVRVGGMSYRIDVR
ncbi:MAG: thiosulfohydrolase SoxB, partial [Halofilum sp. (in: g-proteobacteria)]|nr:thiosulfohydrolase SoxB [Halofilum sp. (in: g-proteobacteria)]